MLISADRERQEALEAEARAIAEKEARLADEQRRREQKALKKEERLRQQEEVRPYWNIFNASYANVDTHASSFRPLVTLPKRLRGELAR